LAKCCDLFIVDHAAKFYQENKYDFINLYKRFECSLRIAIANTAFFKQLDALYHISTFAVSESFQEEALFYKGFIEPLSGLSQTKLFKYAEEQANELT